MTMDSHLPSIGVDAAQAAINAGGTLEKMPYPFFSGGHTYTHRLTNKRGRQFRVSQWVAKQLRVPHNAGVTGTEPKAERPR